jgi:hypothetical protein
MTNTTIQRLTVRRDAAIDALPPHLAAIMAAVRDHDIGYGIVLPNASRFRLPEGRPTILAIGNDLARAHGPDAWHLPSLRRFARRCRLALIIAAAPVPELYATAAHEAAIHRREVILVETRPRYEADWLACIQRAGPHLAVTLSTTPAEGTA